MELDDEHLGLLGSSRVIERARIQDQIPRGQLLLSPRLLLDLGDLGVHVEGRLVDLEFRHAIPGGRLRSRLVDGAVSQSEDGPLVRLVVDQASVGRRDDPEGLGVALVTDQHSAELGRRQIHLVGVHDDVADPGEGLLLDHWNGGVLTELAEALEERRGPPRIDPDRQRGHRQRHGERSDQKRAEQAQRADTQGMERNHLEIGRQAAARRHDRQEQAHRKRVTHERQQQQGPQLKHQIERCAIHGHVAEVLQPVHHVEEGEHADGDDEDGEHLTVDVAIENRERHSHEILPDAGTGRQVREG